MDLQPPLLGETLADRYEIRRKVGEGRTGSVYAAIDLVERRKVAVKVLHAPLCELHEHLRRFEREFEITRRVDHPHTVRMYEFGQAGELRFLVMEFLEGKRLDQLVAARGELTVHEVCGIAVQIAEALHAAHAQGVIHRDLNPSNIMLLQKSPTNRGPREHVKVLDFGLSRLLDNQEELTGVGTRLGSSEYMAPEYIAHSQLDERSDLYGFGCILFHMLTGRPPFVGPSMRVLHSHLQDPAPAPSSVNPGLPHWIDQLVLSLLEKDPDARPSLEEVIEELRRHGDAPALTQDSNAPAIQDQSASVITTGLAHRGALPGGTRPSGPNRSLVVAGIALPVVIAVVSLAGVGLIIGLAALVFLR